MIDAPSGEQFELAQGEQRATIVEVGGGVREFRVGQRDVLQPYAREAMCDGAHGAPLIPWPNRLADGRYSFDGVQHQVALTEPEKHNAIHGFLRWRPWVASEHDAERVVMTARLLPLAGYPFALEVRVTYTLADDGLTVSTSARNIGHSACPYAAGQHPYLSPGDALIDDCQLELPARTRILTDEDRQLPCGREAVEGTAFDFREPRQIGQLQIDHAYTDLQRGPGGDAVTRLRAPDGCAVELWVDEHHSFLEVYTGDTLAPERRRRGLGLEPMTCAPNAFQSGEDLIHLEPGASVTTRWGVRLID